MVNPGSPAEMSELIEVHVCRLCCFSSHENHS